jgi:hypothetical protein
MKNKRPLYRLISSITVLGTGLLVYLFVVGFHVPGHGPIPEGPPRIPSPVEVKACNGNLPCFLNRRGGPGSLTNQRDYYLKLGAIRPNPADPAKEIIDTLANFKARNGFGGGNVVQAIYFNSGDLNLGRDMNCSQSGTTIACYVSNYGPVPGAQGWPNADVALNDAVHSPGHESAAPFATVAMEYSRPYDGSIGVKESDGATSVTPTQCPFTGSDAPPSLTDIDTGIDIGPGDQVDIKATGQIWAGVCLTGKNGPEGWNNIDNDPKFPLAGSRPYALIGKLGAGGSYFYIGSDKKLTDDSETPRGERKRLFLRTNDDMPGNGTGSFQVQITILTAGAQFFVYGGDGQLFTDKVVLDAEVTPRFTPQICLACHGGRYNPTSKLVDDASFLPFDVGSFKYHPSRDKVSQESQFRQLNAFVRATTGTSLNTNNPISTLIDGWYPSATSGAAGINYTPNEWSSHRDLYLDFVRPFCRTCHIAQESFRDWTTYQQFEDRRRSGGLEAQVCNTLQMPHAQVPFETLRKSTKFSAGVKRELAALGITCVR